jgi:hypothetical protein
VLFSAPRRGAAPQDGDGRPSVLFGTNLYNVEWSAEEHSILEARARAARRARQQPRRTARSNPDEGLCVGKRRYV